MIRKFFTFKNLSKLKYLLVPTALYSLKHITDEKDLITTYAKPLLIDNLFRGYKVRCHGGLDPEDLEILKSNPKQIFEKAVEYEKSGNYSKAFEYYKAVCEYYEEKFSEKENTETYVLTLKKQGDMLWEMNKKDSAGYFYWVAKEVSENFLGELHPLTIELRNIGTGRGFEWMGYQDENK